MKLAVRFMAPVLGLAFLTGTLSGCNNSTDVQVADPSKANVPPPPPPPKAGDAGQKPPKGGGSPAGDPSQYTR